MRILKRVHKIVAGIVVIVPVTAGLLYLAGSRIQLDGAAMPTLYVAGAVRESLFQHLSL
jgi:hypothetical protein